MILSLEKQVTSLELSRKLKELGVPQRGAFLYWTKCLKHEEKDFTINIGLPTGTYSGESATVYDHGPEHWQDGEIFAAYTAAELAVFLPTQVNVPLKGGRPRKDSHNIAYSIWGGVSQGNSVARRYRCGLAHRTAIFYHNEISDVSEAEARGQLLAWLVEQKYPSFSLPV